MARRRSNPFIPKSSYVGCKGKKKPIFDERKRKAKEMSTILNETGVNEEGNPADTIWNNPDLRKLVLREYRKGTKVGEIASIAKENGFDVAPAKITYFMDKRMNTLSKGEVMKVRDSIFYDIERLDCSIDKIVTILEEKIDSWKDNEKKNKELMLGISQLREYQVLALKKLGIIKDAIQKVDRQFNQTNIIVAQHQTDYLKELVLDGKIKIVDSTLLDLVFGKAVNHADSTPPEAKEGEKVG